MRLPFCSGLRPCGPACLDLLDRLGRSRFTYPNVLRDRIQRLALHSTKTQPWSPVVAALTGLPFYMPHISDRIETVMGAYYAMKGTLP